MEFVWSFGESFQNRAVMKLAIMKIVNNVTKLYIQIEERL